MGASARRTWRAVQWIGLSATALLLVGLVVSPSISLAVLWNVVIPLIPATLLISPMLWRNSCPLATLNQLTNRVGPRRVPGARRGAATAILGIFLLAVLVPARRFVFNTDGPALAVTILLVAVAALLMGALFDMKAGFCNAFCPVLPVERLYGQRPLLRIGNARCPSCTNCSSACIDLSAHKSIPQLLGRARSSPAWLRTPFGAFSAAFPGFVLAYFMAVDASAASAGAIYVGALTLAGASYVFVTLAVRALELPSTRVIPTLAALAAGLYYWFAAPSVAETLGVRGAGGQLLRASALALVVAWWWNAQRTGSTSGKVALRDVALRPNQGTPVGGAPSPKKPDRGEA
jgi:hypothetical protein